MQIDEAYADSQAPNSAAINNARGVVLKRKLVGLFRSPDETLLFGECKGSGKDNYQPSADFADPAKPVFRCTCPSRQFPCKHSLALLYAYAQGTKFVEKEVPAEISEKRSKVQQRAEKKKEESAKPQKVNTSALRKKIETQLAGLDLLESLVNDLVRAGLGALNPKSARQVDEQAKQLGNSYLPGAQNALHALTGLFYRGQISSEDELKASEREQIYSASLDQLNRLHSLCRQGRKYLSSRLEDPELKPETESDIAAWLGHVWQLRELKEASLVQPNVELLQLAFNSHDDWTRREFVETGVWLNLQNGSVQLTRNYRPYQAAKFIREDDSCFHMVVCPELCVYPGNMNPRVRWETMEPRPVNKEDYRRAREHAKADLRTVLKEVKSQLRSPLGDRRPFALVRYRSLSRAGDAVAMEDQNGERVMLTDTKHPGEPNTLHLLPMLPKSALREQAMLLRFSHDLDTQRLHAKPLSVVTETEIIRLAY
ncbi:MAG TPA: SWIM zinc finger family protein [Candidatus Saccharimonadales bacterium]|nr:SWIM zinc finger family protein [Candidatus Saccharimonadales bacterium]